MDSTQKTAPVKDHDAMFGDSDATSHLQSALMFDDPTMGGLDYTEEEKELFALITGFYRTKILATALEYEVFTFLSMRPRTLLEFANKLEFPERSMRIFIDALINLNLIALTETGKYKNTGMSSKYLVQGKISYLADTVELFNSLYEESANLSEMFKTGRPLKQSYSYFFGKSNAETEISEYSDQMHRTSGSPAMALSEFCDFKNSKVVLDIGGGIGKTCMNLVSQYSHLQTILFDLPAVCKKAEKEISSFWLANRIKIQPGDFFKDNFPIGFDTALMMRITHDWSLDQIKTLFQKIFNALPSGGKLVVYETFKDDKYGNPGDAAMVSLLLLTISPEGECRSKSEIKQMLIDVGFTSVEFVHTVYIYSAVIGYKS